MTDTPEVQQLLVGVSPEVLSLVRTLRDIVEEVRPDAPVKGIVDPEGLLEGTGKGMRHIKVRGPRDIRRDAFKALVRQAFDG